jgi:hypothetical protein
MSFNGQLNMFFGMLISFTCDLHLKLDILNPLNIIFYQMILKMSHYFTIIEPSNNEYFKFLMLYFYSTTNVLHLIFYSYIFSTFFENCAPKAK